MLEPQDCFNRNLQNLCVIGVAVREGHAGRKVTSLNGRVESATIPAAKKADLKAKVSMLQVFSYVCMKFA
ncbi:hypothetical protein LOK49_LG01G02369 [Camellia lanceoleosa]|uniref:Uncharacterized protein n=1 Tax=Camellia lanceoleosa TaxID=1840588 RepID=A0ACC0J4S5_9ERIC|nr:hypothetical protein LOK49_LG01G02369 [Camellia lanceoleosa]